MKEGLRRKRHPKLWKALTLGGSIFGLIVTLALVVLLVLTMGGVNDMFTDELRTYTARFYSDGALISERTYRRGDLLEQPAAPEKQADGQQNYIFIGWDITGEGIPDPLPVSMYYSFNANAVYFGYGNFTLSLEDLQNMDINTLITLLENLNVDWEQFMEMFNLSLEDLLALLESHPIFTYTTSGSQYITYFRTTSYGNFDYRSKRFNNASIYDPNLISSGSVNPLRYTADKVSSAFASGLLPDAFGFVDYQINYATSNSPYPVPDIEHLEDMYEERLNTDAYSQSQPGVDGYYETSGAYIPAFKDVINAVKLMGYSNSAISSDERRYRTYAREHYLDVPSEYYETLDRIIEENEWDPDDYFFVDEIGNFVESSGRFNLFDEEGNITLNGNKNSDPVLGLLENEVGSDYDFNALAIMLFRRLNIPARMVQGYISPLAEAYPAVNKVTFLNQHYWCEIYVDDIGWMICDCTNGEQLLGFNPYGGNYDNKANPISDEKDKPDDPGEFIEPEEITSDMSGDVSTEGSGDRVGKEHEVFTFKSDYEGTVYFRSKAYDYYDPAESSWSLTYDAKDWFNFGNYSPLFFAYQPLKQLYIPKSVEITYSENMKYGVSPAYTTSYPSRLATTGSDVYTSQNVPANTKQTYQSIDFPISVSMLNYLQSVAKEMSDSSTYKQYELNYRESIVPTFYRNLDISYELGQELGNFANTYNLYSYSNTNEQIVAVYEAFKNNYRYNADFSAYPEGTDPVLSFLQRKEGICNNFASAATLLYRYLGIAARYVTGYGSISKGSGETNVVTSLSAHAWVEVYVDGVGWIKIDPTGFDDGQGDGTRYGGGFGGGDLGDVGGTGNYQYISGKRTLKVAYNFDNYMGYVWDGYGDYSWKVYYKTYDAKPLPENCVYIENSAMLYEGHHIEIDDTVIKNLGANAPGSYYEEATVKIIEDATGNDVTDTYYTIENDGFDLRIDRLELYGSVNANTSFGYDGINPTIIDQDDYIYFNVSAYNSLFENQVIYFIPNELVIDDDGEYIVTGVFVILDPDVTPLATFDPKTFDYNDETKNFTYLYDISIEFPTITVS